MVMELDDDDFDETAVTVELAQDNSNTSSYGSPQLSLNALIGTSNLQTMRATCLHNKNPSSAN